MITVSTTSPGETRDVTDLFRKAPAHLDWQVYQLGTPVAASADLRTWTDPDRAERLHPGHERMRQLLIQRGQDGYLSSKLWEALRDEGQVVARETLHRWLSVDERAGYVFRTGGLDLPGPGGIGIGTVRSRWIWAGDVR